MKKNKSRGQRKYGLISYLGPATKPFKIYTNYTNLIIITKLFAGVGKLAPPLPDTKVSQ